ncbi:MAG TPA: VCBS repeat-containing protein [Thermoanaerobaculia bacterium]
MRAKHLLAALALTLFGAADSHASLFKPYVVLPAGEWPEALASGDLDADGHRDIVVANATACNTCDLLAFFQGPTGTFTAPVHVATLLSTSVAVGDFDKNGLLDIVAATGAGVSVFLQTSPRAFAAPAEISLFQGAFKVAVEDVDHDGHDDIIAVPWGSNADDIVHILLNDSQGGFTLVERTLAHYGYDDLKLADLNGDGINDMLVVSGQGTLRNNIGVLYGTGDSSLFGPPAYLDAGYPSLWESVVVTPVPGHLPGLALASGDNLFVQLLSQPSAGAFTATATLPVNTWPEGLLAADLDGDGRVDLAAVRDKFQYWPQNCGGGFEPRHSLEVPWANYQNSHEFAVGDFNSDGLRDVAIASDNHGVVLLLRDPDFLSEKTFESGSLCEWSGISP